MQQKFAVLVLVSLVCCLLFVPASFSSAATQTRTCTNGGTLNVLRAANNFPGTDKLDIVGAPGCTINVGEDAPGQAVAAGVLTFRNLNDVKIINVRQFTCVTEPSQLNTGRNNECIAFTAVGAGTVPMEELNIRRATFEVIEPNFDQTTGFHLIGFGDLKSVKSMRIEHCVFRYQRTDYLQSTGSVQNNHLLWMRSANPIEFITSMVFSNCSVEVKERNLRWQSYSAGQTHGVLSSIVHFEMPLQNSGDVVFRDLTIYNNATVSGYEIQSMALQFESGINNVKSLFVQNLVHRSGNLGNGAMYLTSHETLRLKTLARVGNVTLVGVVSDGGHMWDGKQFTGSTPVRSGVRFRAVSLEALEDVDVFTMRDFDCRVHINSTSAASVTRSHSGVNISALFYATSPLLSTITNPPLQQLSASAPPPPGCALTVDNIALRVSSGKTFPEPDDSEPISVDIITAINMDTTDSNFSRVIFRNVELHLDGVHYWEKEDVRVDVITFQRNFIYHQLYEDANNGDGVETNIQASLEMSGVVLSGGIFRGAALDAATLELSLVCVRRDMRVRRFDLRDSVNRISSSTAGGTSNHYGLDFTSHGEVLAENSGSRINNVGSFGVHNVTVDPPESIGDKFKGVFTAVAVHLKLTVTSAGSPGSSLCVNESIVGAGDGDGDGGLMRFSSVGIRGFTPITTDKTLVQRVFLASILITTGHQNGMAVTRPFKSLIVKDCFVYVNGFRASSGPSGTGPYLVEMYVLFLEKVRYMELESFQILNATIGAVPIIRGGGGNNNNNNEQQQHPELVSAGMSEADGLHCVIFHALYGLLSYFSHNVTIIDTRFLFVDHPIVVTGAFPSGKASKATMIVADIDEVSGGASQTSEVGPPFVDFIFRNSVLRASDVRVGMSPDAGDLNGQAKLQLIKANKLRQLNRLVVSNIVFEARLAARFETLQLGMRIMRINDIPNTDLAALTATVVLEDIYVNSSMAMLETTSARTLVGMVFFFMPLGDTNLSSATIRNLTQRLHINCSTGDPAEAANYAIRVWSNSPIVEIRSIVLSDIHLHSVAVLNDPKQVSRVSFVKYLLRFSSRDAAPLKKIIIANSTITSILARPSSHAVAAAIFDDLINAPTVFELRNISISATPLLVDQQPVWSQGGDDDIDPAPAYHAHVSLFESVRGVIRDAGTFVIADCHVTVQHPRCETDLVFALVNIPLNTKTGCPYGKSSTPCVNNVESISILRSTYSVSVAYAIGHVRAAMFLLDRSSDDDPTLASVETMMDEPRVRNITSLVVDRSNLTVDIRDDDNGYGTRSVALLASGGGIAVSDVGSAVVTNSAVNIDGLTTQDGENINVYFFLVGGGMIRTGVATPWRKVGTINVSDCNMVGPPTSDALTNRASVKEDLVSLVGVSCDFLWSVRTFLYERNSIIALHFDLQYDSTNDVWSDLYVEAHHVVFLQGTAPVTGRFYSAADMLLIANNNNNNGDDPPGGVSIFEVSDRISMADNFMHIETGSLIDGDNDDSTQQVNASGLLFQGVVARANAISVADNVFNVTMGSTSENLQFPGAVMFSLAQENVSALPLVAPLRRCDVLRNRVYLTTDTPTPDMPYVIVKAPITSFKGSVFRVELNTLKVAYPVVQLEETLVEDTKCAVVLFGSSTQSTDAAPRAAGIFEIRGNLLSSCDIAAVVWAPSVGLKPVAPSMDGTAPAATQAPFVPHETRFFIGGNALVTSSTIYKLNLDTRTDIPDATDAVAPSRSPYSTSTVVVGEDLRQRLAAGVLMVIFRMSRTKYLDSLNRVQSRIVTSANTDVGLTAWSLECNSWCYDDSVGGFKKNYSHNASSITVNQTCVDISHTPSVTATASPNDTSVSANRHVSVTKTATFPTGSASNPNSTATVPVSTASASPSHSLSGGNASLSKSHTSSLPIPPAPPYRSVLNGPIGDTIAAAALISGSSTAAVSMSRQKKLLKLGHGCGDGTQKRDVPDLAANPLQMGIGDDEDFRFLRGVLVANCIFLAIFMAVCGLLAYLAAEVTDRELEKGARIVRFPGVTAVPLSVFASDVASAAGTVLAFSGMALIDLAAVSVGIVLLLVVPVIILIWIHKHCHSSGQKLEEISKEPPSSSSSRTKHKKKASLYDKLGKAFTWFFDPVDQQWADTRFIQFSGLFFDMATSPAFMLFDFVTSAAIGIAEGLTDGEAPAGRCIGVSIFSVVAFVVYGLVHLWLHPWLSRYDRWSHWCSIVLAIVSSVLVLVQHLGMQDEMQPYLDVIAILSAILGFVGLLTLVDVIRAFKDLVEFVLEKRKREADEQKRRHEIMSSSAYLMSNGNQFYEYDDDDDDDDNGQELLSRSTDAARFSPTNRDEETRGNNGGKGKGRKRRRKVMKRDDHVV